MKRHYDYDIIIKVANSVYISRQYEFVDKILKTRKRKRIKLSFFLSLFFHTFLFVLLSLSLKFSYQEKKILITETYIDFAEYKPLEKKTEMVDKVTENITEETKNITEEVEPKTEEKLELPKRTDFLERPKNFEWRENVKQKFIKQEAKIITPKISEIAKSKPQETQASPLNDEVKGYLRALTLTIKSHWQIPEDIYNRLQGYSTDFEIFIDEKGVMKYKIVKRSGSNVFDYYTEESLKRTFSNLPPQLAPPKELIEYLEKGGRILLEFKL